MFGEVHDTLLAIQVVSGKKDFHTKKGKDYEIFLSVFMVAFEEATIQLWLSQ